MVTLVPVITRVLGMVLKSLGEEVEELLWRLIKNKINSKDSGSQKPLTGSTSGACPKKEPSPHKREMIPYLSGTPQTVRMLFHLAASVLIRFCGLILSHVCYYQANITKTYIIKKKKKTLDMTTNYDLSPTENE